jgi:hypothetical protein
MVDLLPWAAFAVSVGLLIVAVVQAWIYRAQAKIMHQTLALTQRPRIRIRHVVLDRIYDQQSSPFESRQPIYGRFDIVNIGGSVARVVTWQCHLRFGRADSPPEWPQNVDPDPESDRFESVHPILFPGVHAELCYKSRYPLQATYGPELRSSSPVPGGTRLYVIGRITYADETGVTRTTGFCRRWEQGTQIPRFDRVDDPDLEYED